MSILLRCLNARDPAKMQKVQKKEKIFDLTGSGAVVSGFFERKNSCIWTIVIVVPDGEFDRMLSEYFQRIYGCKL